MGTYNAIYIADGCTTAKGREHRVKHLNYLFIAEKDRQANENRFKNACLLSGIRTRITAGQCPPLHHRVHHICPHILLKMIKLEVLSKTFPSKLFFLTIVQKEMIVPTTETEGGSLWWCTMVKIFKNCAKVAEILHNHVSNFCMLVQFHPVKYSR